MIKFIFKIAQNFLVLLLVSVINVSCVSGPGTYQIDHAQGEISGEASALSIILQSRLTRGRNLIQGDMPGAAGVGCFYRAGRRELFVDCDAEVYAAGGGGVVDLLFAAFIAEGVFRSGALSNVQRAEHAFFICMIAYCGDNWLMK